MEFKQSGNSAVIHADSLRCDTLGGGANGDTTSALEKIYDRDFYKDHQNDTLRSAQVIVPLILEVFPVKSVIDVGCGTCAWLSVFQRCGVSAVKGYDVSRLSPEEYYIDPRFIVTGCDLSSTAFQIPETSEMVSCLEVAEHLPDSVSDHLVRMLTQTAPLVLFSAAFPEQTGVNHINEQPPWYWRKKFHNCGYIEIDYLRPRIWSDRRICWWYRQNVTLYVKPDYLQMNAAAYELSVQYPELKEAQRLTLVNERILKKLISAARSPVPKEDQSRSIAETAVIQKPVVIQDCLEAIQVEMEKKDYNAALKKLNTVAESYPQLQRIHFFRAFCLQQLGQLPEARLAILYELKNNPGHSESMNILRTIEQKLYERQPKIKPGDIPSNEWLKTVYMGKNQ